MNKLSLYFLLIFVLAFFSCNNSQVIYEDDLEISTIKKSILDKESNTLWTSELEGDFLKTNYEYNGAKIANSLPVTFDLFYFDLNYKDKILPELESFGSLDTSKIPDDLLSKIRSFIKDVSENPYGDFSSYFDKSFYFSYIFFLDQLKTNYQKYFKIEFPYKELNCEKSELQNSSDSDTENVVYPALFTSNRIGQAFISSDLIQIPVRLYNKKSYLDILIFVKVKNYLIYNIEIKNWSK